MNWKTWVPLVLAIVLGVFAAKVAKDTLMKNRAASGPAGKFVKIVVAKEDIQPGQEIKPEQIDLRRCRIALLRRRPSATKTSSTAARRR